MTAVEPEKKGWGTLKSLGRGEKEVARIKKECHFVTTIGLRPTGKPVIFFSFKKMMGGEALTKKASAREKRERVVGNSL